MQSSKIKKQKVIVIGGGFAGLQFARHLEAALFDVLLIDRLNHHQFQPLFYQVATSRLEPSSISFPFRKIFQRSQHVQIRLAEVLQVNPADNSIITTIGRFEYDHLVIATGCKTNFFGNESITEHAYTLKSTYEAINIRNNILLSFEQLFSASEAEKEGIFNIVIVGAGPTGVEMAGAFVEMKQNILPKDYRGVDFSKLNVILLEGSDNTLNSMSEMAKKASRTYLEQMGVTVRTGVIVKNYDGNTVTLNDGTVILSKNLIWAAGVTGNLIAGIDPAIITRANRITVDRYNRVAGQQNIYAIGDIAYMETPKYPKGHPQLANVAINQGKNLARNFRNLVRHQPLNEYEYQDLGSMATIGKNKAVVDLPFYHFKGYLAWFLWMSLHLMLILSVRNKLIIFFNWAWSYITRDTSLRLILKDTRKKT